MTSPTLIIGLGNPILGDDGIGWVVADRVKQALGLSGTAGSPFDPQREIAPQADVEIDRLSLGGLSLMERLVGYEKVILIDSIQTGREPTGTVWQFTLAELGDPSGGHTTAPHDTSLKNAIRVGRSMGADLPELDEIFVVAVEAKQVFDFSETLTPEVDAAIEPAVKAVIEHLKKTRFEPVGMMHSACSRK